MFKQIPSLSVGAIERERGDWLKIDAPEIFISRDISFTGEREEKGAMEAGRRLGII